MSLKACQLTFSYPSSPHNLFEGLNFELKEKQIRGLFGQSGSGKSSFARLLAGYEKDYNGQIRLDQKPLPQNTYCPVQLIHQHPEKTFNPFWTMRKSLQEARVNDQYLLQTLAIQKEWLSRRPNELSGGEKQRFAIARALHPSCRYLICDEMTTMLDALTQLQLWQDLLKIVQQRGMGLLIISHDMNLLNQICTDIYQFTPQSIYKLKN